MRSTTGTALLLLAALFLLPDTPAQAAQTAPDAERFTIRLGAAEATPAAGRWTPPSDADAAFLVQLHKIPDPDAVARWRARGVELLRYAGGNAYVVRAPGEGRDLLASSPAVRATLALEPAMKRSPAFDRDPALAARARRGEPLALDLRFFPHVSFDRARTLLASLGVDAEQERYGYGRSIVAHATWPELLRLLESDDVAWIDPLPPPAGPANRNAGERARVDRVLDRPGFRGADGSGVHIGIWDWFTTGSGHTDLEGRVDRTGMRPRNESLHGLWVSGTAAGAGLVDPKGRGMAPAASLHWYSWSSDIWSRIAAARADDGVRITNHSWTLHPGWRSAWDADPPHFVWSGDRWAFGYYHAMTADADELARSTDVLLVMAAGNDRELSFLGPHTHGTMVRGDEGVLSEDGVDHEDLHPLNPRHASIVGPAIGKNVLTVGATTKDDEMSWFSSWGPTADGRVKPDLVAVGVDVTTTTVGDGYATNWGTSLAAPVVSGIAALLADYYARSHGAEPSALTLKGLLIHAARDLGRPGPDYVYGHGMVDAQLAARVLRAADRGEAGLASVLVERRLSHGQKRRLFFDVPPGARELEATLVWHDAPGERLVNDLDLWLVSPSREVFRPFVLDPERPLQAARRGVNRIDNVERARVDDPEPGRWWVFVQATRVPMGPQSYSLIVSAGDGNRPPEKHTEGACGITRFYATDEGPGSPSLSRPQDVFRHGDPFYLTTRFYVPDNADYGDFYGSIHVTWTVEDGSGEVILREGVSTTRRYILPREWGSFFTEQRYRIPRELPAGAYVGRTVVRMHNGAEAAAEFPFRIAAD